MNLETESSPSRPLNPWNAVRFPCLKSQERKIENVYPMILILPDFSLITTNLWELFCDWFSPAGESSWARRAALCSTFACLPLRRHMHLRWRGCDRGMLRGWWIGGYIYQLTIFQVISWLLGPSPFMVDFTYQRIPFTSQLTNHSSPWMACESHCSSWQVDATYTLIWNIPIYNDIKIYHDIPFYVIMWIHVIHVGARPTGFGQISLEEALSSPLVIGMCLQRAWGYCNRINWES